MRRQLIDIVGSDLQATDSSIGPEIEKFDVVPLAQRLKVTMESGK
jgi:hypothetical protein